MSRPDPQAPWQKSLLKTEWSKVNAQYTRVGTKGSWKILKEVSKPWQVTLGGFTFSLELLPSKHLGVFPEQSGEWRWLVEKIKKEVDSGRKISVLNLFAYTGGASLACAKAGASVCHVDSSKFAVDLAHSNLNLSGLGNAEVRFIVDDVRKFVEREIKRGKKYDVILLDPPVYGKGLKGEVWKIEEDLMPLLTRLKNILSENPLCVLLNGYSSGYTHVSYAQMLSSAIESGGGEISSGELAIAETSSKRLLPSGIYALWQKK